MDPHTKNTIQDETQILIEELMNLNSSNETYNITEEELKQAGNLYVYLNMCPEKFKYSMMRLELEDILRGSNNSFIEDQKLYRSYFHV